VETTTAPLRVISPPPVQKTVDATLAPRQVVVDDYGAPAQATSVERKVFAPDGSLLSDSTWSSSYRSMPKIIRVGPPAKPKKPKKSKKVTSPLTSTVESAPSAPH
jgi:hypothetical protein